MRELSIFVDESGSDGLSDRHYLLTVVMHDQSESIADSIAAYEGALRAKGLPDIPFHASPLMNGKDQYSGLDLRTRKMLLGSFRVFFRHMPVRYHTFAYATKQFASLDKLAGTMRRDLVNFLFDNLAELQSYDMVKVYYDNGQQSRSIARSSTRSRRTPSSTDRRSPPSTGFRRRRTTSAPWNSRRSNTRSIQPPRRTRSSSANGPISRRAYLRRHARSFSRKTARHRGTVSHRGLAAREGPLTASLWVSTGSSRR